MIGSFIKYRRPQYAGNVFVLVSILLLISSLIGAFNLFVYHFAKHEIRRRSMERYNSILNHSTQRWLDTEDIIDRLLVNSLKLTEQYLVNSKNHTPEALGDIKEDLKISNIVIFNPDGTMFKVTHTALTAGTRLNQMYKNFSILSPNMCPSYVDLQQNTKNPTIINTVFTFNKERKIPVKYSIMWSSRLKKYLQISYENDYIKTTVQKIVDLHDELEYMAVYTPSGHSIIEKSTDKNINFKRRYNKYLDQIIVEEDKEYVYLTKSFGGIVDPSRACVAINNGLAGKDGEYFYIVSMVFNKEEMNRAIWLSKMLIAMITIVSLLIITLIISKEIATIYKTPNQGDRI